MALPATLPTRQEWSTAVMDMVSAIGAAGGTLQSIWGGPKHLQTDTSEVVLALERRPVDGIYRELQSARSDVHCIGDAASPTEVEAVIYEAEALARYINDSETGD